MLGLHTELAEREAAGTPVRIGLIGAGQMGTDVVAETTMMRGIEVVATADIDLQRARNAYTIAGIKDDVIEATTPAQADAAVRAGQRIIVGDYRVITDMNQIDVMLEATGVPEIGARADLRDAGGF